MRSAREDGMKRDLRVLAGLTTLAGLAGCPAFTTPEPYYGAGPKPDVSELSPAEEAGSAGGQEIEIIGSNFGDDASKLMVIFAQSNAEILEAADDRLLVRVPPGPLEGGAVDVRVTTPTGYALVEGGYTYDVGEIGGDQRAYVLINNFPGQGVFGYSPTSGTSAQGMSGSAEAYSFHAGRYHTASVAFWGSFDESADRWTVESPASNQFAFGVEDLREDPGAFSIRRTDLDEVTTYCVDLDPTAAWTGSNGQRVSGDRVPTTEVLEGDVACDEGLLEYHDDELRFCQHLSEEGVPNLTYEADWPVWNGTRPVDFFFGRSGVTVALDMPDLGIEGDASPELALPEPIAASVEGFEDPAGWSGGSIESCLEGDVPYTVTWAPSAMDLSAVEEPAGEGGSWADGQITSARTHVRVSIDISPYGWFGLNTPLRRAVITVPDDYNSDGRNSQVEIPREVLEQLPFFSTFPGSFGGSAQKFDTTQAYGVMYLTVARITEYAVHSTELNGDVVVAYVTGEVGFYTGWSLPSGGCP